MKAGLEIHQQLNVPGKLFCSCPSDAHAAKVDAQFVRRLRAVRSEVGRVDAAALFEEHRGREFVYQVSNSSSCLVEMDEEPPHRLNEEALDVALMVSQLLGCKPVDEVQVMRKLVIDGSNTSGFQRTALIATDGALEVDGKTVRVSTVCLEEDAAKLVAQDAERGVVTYSLERLGVPLVEISTMPDITGPEEAEKVAAAIGGILRRTRRVKRGLGSIRQDVNVSADGGARVEVKGVQLLSLVGKVIESETRRQSGLIQLRDKLRSHPGKFLADKPVNLGELFASTKSKIVRSTLAAGQSVLGVRVIGFRGVFGFQLGENRRFGTELADYARQLAGVGGLLHSDELPAYGISQDEVKAVKEVLGCLDDDGFIIILGQTTRASAAFEIVLERCRRAFDGPLEETRAALADGSTRFLRPMPGAERMYPETDVPYVEITGKRLGDVRSKIPPPLESLMDTLVKAGVSGELARQAVNSDWVDVIEKSVAADPASAQLACGLLVQDVKELARDGVDPDQITDEDALKLVLEATSRRMSRDQAKHALSAMAKEGKSVSAAMSDSVSEDELQKVLDEIIEANVDLVLRRGEDAVKPLMGDVMKRLRGKVSGAWVSEALSEKIKRKIRDSDKA
ncbi:MAG: Glu-tRNA(Gln) amidotransferase subunit GatE [Candidatus Marsarchaeota archaeon]|nr:Glu-tRNA(Gln) amidotransferase subunit GatE [Candidatus Marsarchaeota archaeon]